MMGLKRRRCTVCGKTSWTFGAAMRHYLASHRHMVDEMRRRRDLYSGGR